MDVNFITKTHAIIHQKFYCQMAPKAVAQNFNIISKNIKYIGKHNVYLFLFAQKDLLLKIEGRGK